MLHSKHQFPGAKKKVTVVLREGKGNKPFIHISAILTWKPPLPIAERTLRPYETIQQRLRERNLFLKGNDTLGRP